MAIGQVLIDSRLYCQSGEFRSPCSLNDRSSSIIILIALVKPRVLGVFITDVMKLDVFFNTPSFAIFSSERKTIALIVYFPSQLLYHTYLLKLRIIQS